MGVKECESGAGSTALIAISESYTGISSLQKTGIVEQSLDFSDKPRSNIASAACLYQKKAKIRLIGRTRLHSIDFFFSLLT